MNRTKIIFISIFLLTVFGLTYYYVNALQISSNTHHGKVDLSKTDFHKEGKVALNGEWEFYWNQLLSPADFKHHKQRNLHEMKVPGNWLRDSDGHMNAAKGYATYRVRIANIPQDIKYFGLLKENIRNASKIFVNGDLVLQDGQVSKQLEGSIAGNLSKAIYFELENSTADIIVQAANHKYIVGGIAKPMFFGTQDEIMQMHTRKVMFEFSMILIVLIVGLFYSFLFIVNKHYRRKEPATLPLALSCLFFGVANSIYGERIITVFLPEMTLNQTFRFGHLMTALSIVFVLIVVNKMNPVFLSNRIRNGMLGFFGLFILFVLTLPLGVYLNTITVYIVVTFFIFFIIWLKVFILYLKTVKHPNHLVEHRVLLVAIFSIFLYWFDLTLYSFGLKSNMFLSFLTIAIYSISLSSLLIVRYINSYEKNEQLSIQLIETFSTLDQTTKAAQRNEMAFLQAQIKPHFLFNALTSIISLCYTNGARAGQLLTNLSNYLKRSFQVDLTTDFVTLDNELKLIEAFVDIEKVRFGDRMNVTYEIDDGVLSFKIIPLVIEPLVENAIRHGVSKSKSGGEVKLTIKKLEQGLYISVEDNGSGMDVQQVNAILTGKGSLQATTGNGISLRNIHTRLRDFYEVGLHFESDSQGSKVYFTIPLNDHQEGAANVKDSVGR